jgi:hypothetical protein
VRAAQIALALAEFNLAAAVGWLVAPELKLPVSLYDMGRHYRGEGQMDRLCRRPQGVSRHRVVCPERDIIGLAQPDSSRKP